MVCGGGVDAVEGVFVAPDPVIDQALGEAPQIRYHSPVLQSAVDGLFAALCWRAVANHLMRLRSDETHEAIIEAIVVPSSA
jgi:hypothetical protein